MAKTRKPAKARKAVKSGGARSRRRQKRSVRRSPAMGRMEAVELDFSDARAVLRTALETELRGRELYLQYARTVRSSMAKEVFRHLASEELTHIEDIKAFLKSWETGDEGTWLDVAGMTSADSVVGARTIFGRLISEMMGRVSANDDDNRARDVAMEFEKNGYEFYANAARAAKNEKLQQFLEWLTEQEQAHYMFIRNAFDYMNHPDTWHASEEGWLLEG